MGTSKLKTRLTHEAIEDFRKADQYGDNPAVYDGLGQCFHAMKKYNDAIEQFDVAIAQRP